jgi:hypothetical protein
MPRLRCKTISVAVVLHVKVVEVSLPFKEPDMHLTAFFDVSFARWRWKIVDSHSEELERSRKAYASVSEALEAGRIVFREVVRRHTAFSTRRDQVFARSRKSA